MATRTVTVRPQYNSIVASAAVVTERTLRTKREAAPRMLDWQESGWDFYERVGEFRSGINWVANGASRVNLVAARPPKAVGDEPRPLSLDDDDLTPSERRAIELVSYIGGGPAGQGAMMRTFTQVLAVTGFAWLLVEPTQDDPEAEELETWQVLSQDLVRNSGTKAKPQIEVADLGDPKSNDSWRTIHPNGLLVKVWRPNPRRPWQPDAATKGVLTVLTLLDLLSGHVTASGRSRLAGAGILIVPTEVEFPTVPDDDDEPMDASARFDAFFQELVDAMTTPIRDPDNASAVVPLPVQVPAAYADSVKHLTFATPFDDQVLPLMDMAITRLAIGLDMPPEVLKGLTDANHWTAWQVEETAITLHIEPMAETVCQGLTVGFLREALTIEGLEPDAAIVWYDTTDLTSQPDRSGSAVTVHGAGELSAVALRRHSGFEEADAPTDEERDFALLRGLIAGGAATTLKLVAMLKLGLITQPEYDALVSIEAPETPLEGDESDGTGRPVESRRNGPPERAERPPERSSVLAVVAACDVIVHRALERAGARLKTQIGRVNGGGPQAVQWDDPATLHTQHDATRYADLDSLLEGAWTKVADVAEFVDVDAPALEATLNAYARSLLASGHEHDRLRLMNALGADAIA